MFKKVYSLYSAFCTQPAFYSHSAVCILYSVCILPLVRSLQSAVRSPRFTLTANQQMSRPERHVGDITGMRRSCRLCENTSGRRPLGCRRLGCLRSLIFWLGTLE